MPFAPLSGSALSPSASGAATLSCDAEHSAASFPITGKLRQAHWQAFFARQASQSRSLRPNYERVWLAPYALLNDLLRQIEKERTGAYQAPYVFSDATEGY